MANYNTNSVFSVSSAGSMPNKVDDLIFFEDINYDQKIIWDEFEGLIATGDYAAAQALAKSYEDLHGYFADLYNMMVNRLYAAQNLLILNKSRIDAGTSPFNEFVKPKLARYQSTPENIAKDMVWIGPNDYFGTSTEPSINKLKITLANTVRNGIEITVDSDGYITINGTSTDSGEFILGQVPSPSGITSGDIWSYYNYYESGSVPKRTSGAFSIGYHRTDGTSSSITFPSSRTANMHGNLIGITNNDAPVLRFSLGYNETYDNYKAAFMICKAADASPNQKFVPYRG